MAEDYHGMEAMERPRQAVRRELPAFGDSRPDATFRDVEAHQRVVHGRLVDRVARPAFEDRIEGLRAERFDGEDQRAFLILRTNRRARDKSDGTSESRGSRDPPEHDDLPDAGRGST